MDRIPKPAPYPMGARLRYTGKTSWYADPEGKRPIQVPGMEAVVIETRPGRRGTLRDLTDEYDDEPVYDTTTDGWSIVRLESGREIIAVPEHGWEVIA